MKSVITCYVVKYNIIGFLNFKAVSVTMHEKENTYITATAVPQSPV